MKLCLAAILLGMASLSAVHSQEWRKDLTIPTGKYAELRPFEAEFRFGWSNLVDAGKARAKLAYRGDEIRVIAQGGSIGLARSLWQLDATHTTKLKRKDFLPVEIVQNELYKSKNILTHVVSKPDGLWWLRYVTPDPGKDAKWKKIKVAPVRDLVSTMLFVRSQPLRDGDHIELISFPGEAPYLVEITVLGRQTVRAAGKQWKAIRLDLKLQRILTKSKNFGNLEPHGKFSGGKIWISDDADRIPLRAEVNIFIGFVFGELKTITYGAAPTPVRNP